MLLNSPAPTADQNGTPNGALEFSSTVPNNDGNYVRIENGGGLDGLQTGTIAFWVKSTGNAGPGDFASILFDRRTGGDGDVISMKDDGTIFVQAQAGAQGNVNSFATQGSVNDGLWHHVAYVYDQSDTGYIRVYIDGVSSGYQINSAAWSWPPDQQIELGLSHDIYWFGFEGALDEVRFYNRPLSASEVAIIARR